MGSRRSLDEEALFAEQNEAADRAAWTGFIIGIIAAIALAFGLGLSTYLRYGKEPKVNYDQEYEHAPPSDLSPAEVGALLSQARYRRRNSPQPYST